MAGCQYRNNFGQIITVFDPFCTQNRSITASVLLINAACDWGLAAQCGDIINGSTLLVSVLL